MKDKHKTFKRRQVLKGLAVISGSLVYMPSCDFTQDQILGAYRDLEITRGEKRLLMRLCDVMIPTGDLFKGALDVKVVDFILVMVRDCLDKKSKVRYMNGLRNLEEVSKDFTGKVFSKFDQNQASIIAQWILDQQLKRLTSRKVNDVQYFLGKTKDLTIQGFITSEYFMTEVMPYELVPGRFKGKVKISNGHRINIYD